MFRNIQQFFGTTATVEEEVVPELSDDQNGNDYSTVLVLTGHPNVQKVIKLGATKVLSSGNDYKGVVWDTENGDVLCELIGHTRLINCALMIENFVTQSRDVFDVVITGSSDQTLRIWNLSNGNCLQVVTSHESGIKCMSRVSMDSNLIVTGGQNVGLWNTQCRLLTQYQRNSLDYIDTVITIQDVKIVVATDQPFLVIYEVQQSIDPDYPNDVIYTIKKPEKLPSHRESVTSLISISDSMFSSASIDGVIIVWSSQHLSILRKFNQHQDFVSLSDHTHPYSVQCILVAQQRYLFAAIGNGFSIFDIIKGKCICQVNQAHQSQVTCITLLEKGSYIATSSLDGTIRLWTGAHKQSAGKTFTNPIERLFGLSMKEHGSTSVFTLTLIGVCYGHSNSIHSMVDLESGGFVSCSSDGALLLWKNTKNLEKRRDKQLNVLFRKYGWMTS